MEYETDEVGNRWLFDVYTDGYKKTEADGRPEVIDRHAQHGGLRLNRTAKPHARPLVITSWQRGNDRCKNSGKHSSRDIIRTILYSHMEKTMNIPDPPSK